MQLRSKFNEEFIFFVCFIDIYDKYGWVIDVKVKKEIKITNASQKKKSYKNLIAN